jgi:hypothetical protein
MYYNRKNYPIAQTAIGTPRAAYRRLGTSLNTTTTRDSSAGATVGLTKAELVNELNKEAI